MPDGTREHHQRMKIAILTTGTRGDVQPYAVLGQALKLRGHEVVLSTAKNFAGLVKSYGLDFVPVEADFQAILDSEEGKKMLKGNPFAVKRNLSSWIYPLITNSLTEFYKLAKASDKTLFHVKTLADSFADQFPEKMIRANVIPIVEPTREFVNPSFSGLPVPKLLSRLSYTLANLSPKLLGKPVGEFRQKFGFSRKFKIPEIKNVYSMSPSFLPVPKDFPNDSKFNGFWFGEASEEIAEDLQAFLDAGEEPLLLTFGSMPFKAKFDLQTIINKAVEQLDRRFIVVKGWGLQQTESLENNPKIKVIKSAPYEKLFPKVRAIIHHGGIGTTAECLRAGKPLMICPILYPMGDQMFWGKIAHEEGLAVRPKALRKITDTDFLERIKELLENQTLYENARLMKSLIDQENGLQKTIEEIENH
jgi:sterol 3beta-glucosyltransferase